MPFSSFPIGDHPVTRFVEEIERYRQLLTTTNPVLNHFDRIQVLAFAQEIASQDEERRRVLGIRFKELLGGLMDADFQEEVWAALDGTR